MNEFPHFDAPEEEPGAESEQGEIGIATDRCSRFLRQTIPFSEEGHRFSYEAQQALKSKNPSRIVGVAKDLPTVEQPHLELYDKFHLTDEQRKNTFGHAALSSVEITNGCVHQCEICDPPSEKVTHMPGPMVAKIGEEIEKQEEPVKEVWDDWVSHIQKKTGININDLRLAWYKKQIEEGFSSETATLIKTVQAEFPKHPVSQYYDQPYGEQIDLIQEGFGDEGVRRSIFQLLSTNYPMDIVHFSRDLYPYYSSDPFDWRDKNLRHKDGKPADFGDAFKYLARPLRPVYISTAGWPKGDPLGPVAAKKIVETVEESPYLMHVARVSILSAEKLAMRDPKAYCEHMKSVIEALSGIPLNVIFRYDKDDHDFETIIKEPLVAYVEELRAKLPKQYQSFLYTVQAGAGGVSRWKLRQEQPEYSSHTDPAACMGGIHILPDGSVYRQKGSYRKRPPKASRPEPTGLKLY